MDRARLALKEEHREVFDQLLRASHNPDALAGSLLLLLERVPGATWAHVGRALVDLTLAGKPATGKLLLAFTQGAMREDVPPPDRSSGGTKTFGGRPATPPSPLTKYKPPQGKGGPLRPLKDVIADLKIVPATTEAESP